jgi:hypothetical protein
MHREDESAQPRLRYAELAQQAPDQQRVEEMQRNRDEMIAERVGAEPMPFDPQDGLVDRIIFDPDAGLEPELPEAGWVAQQRVRRDVRRASRPTTPLR